MKPMGREANQLVIAGRQAFNPTEADRARLLAALAGTATLSVGAAAAAHSAPPGLSGIFAAVPAARLLALALPLAAAGGIYAWQANSVTTSSLQSPPVVRAPRVLTRPAEVEVPQTVEPAPPESLPVEAPREPSPTPAERNPSAVVEPSKPGGEIRQEVLLLSRAQVALSKGRPQEALDALAEHALRFPRGALMEERAATRARTLCALGRKSEAETELARMEKVNPTSAYLARARQSCGSR